MGFFGIERLTIFSESDFGYTHIIIMYSLSLVIFCYDLSKTFFLWLGKGSIIKDKKINQSEMRGQSDVRVQGS